MSGAGLLGIIPLSEWDWPTLKTFVIGHGRWIVFCPPSCRPEAAAAAAQHGLWLRALDSQRVSLEPKRVIRGEARPSKERDIGNAKARVKRLRAAVQKEDTMPTAAEAPLPAGPAPAEPAPYLFDLDRAFLGSIKSSYWREERRLWLRLSPEEQLLACQLAWLFSRFRDQLLPLAEITGSRLWQQPLASRQIIVRAVVRIFQWAEDQVRANQRTAAPGNQQTSPD